MCLNRGDLVNLLLERIASLNSTISNTTDQSRLKVMQNTKRLNVKILQLINPKNNYFKNNSVESKNDRS